MELSEATGSMGSNMFASELEIAELLFQRKTYNQIAGELRVSPKTISMVRRKIQDGLIMVDEKGKAKYAEDRVVLKAPVGHFTLSEEQVLRIYGIAHLENLSPSEVVDTLLNEDYKLRKKYGLSFKNIKVVSDFLDAAMEIGWHISSEPSILNFITNLWNCGAQNLPPETVSGLISLLNDLKARKWNPLEFVKEATDIHNAVYWYRQYKAGYISAQEFKQKVAFML